MRLIKTINFKKEHNLFVNKKKKPFVIRKRFVKYSKKVFSKNKKKPLTKIFLKILNINKINEFITITKIIIKSNQLAKINDDFIVIDYIRF